MRKLNNLENALIKNRVLDNSSNKISKIFFEKFKGEKSIKIGTGGFLNNGYIYLDIKCSEKFELFYKNILIFSTSENMQKMIPCLFESDTILTLKGNCENLTLLIYGANIIDRLNDYYLPINNSIVKYTGSDYSVYSYSDKDNLINNDLQFEKELSGVVDIQTVVFEGVSHIGCLLKKDNLVFVSSIDNYTNNYIIIENCKDAKIVPDNENNCIYAFYIKDNLLFYKIISEGFVISEETLVSLNVDDRPRSFSSIVINSFGVPIVAVVTKNKTIIMVIEGNQVLTKMIKKSTNITIFISNDIIEIFQLEANCLNISKYQVIKNDNINIVTNMLSKSIYNVDRLIKINDNYLLFNGNYCTEVSNDSLFRS